MAVGSMESSIASKVMPKAKWLSSLQASVVIYRVECSNVLDRHPADKKSPSAFADGLLTREPSPPGISAPITRARFAVVSGFPPLAD